MKIQLISCKGTGCLTIKNFSKVRSQLTAMVTITKIEGFRPSFLDLWFREKTLVLTANDVYLGKSVKLHQGVCISCRGEKRGGTAQSSLE